MRRPLTLRSETLTDLTPEHLSGVVGAALTGVATCACTSEIKDTTERITHEWCDA